MMSSISRLVIHPVENTEQTEHSVALKHVRPHGGSEYSIKSFSFSPKKKAIFLVHDNYIIGLL